ncbi:glycosyltransferase family 2 protein [Virgibacillus halodenitrificans]|uniref:glycosyltransferase family 2 protein n=1 Tax=Virgibacillus halodenitrificans TaxID=1482 RepID=UPI001F3A1CAB|nr:glycosyltransferase family 2 protein [Virgibacillus halodenitrificans]
MKDITVVLIHYADPLAFHKALSSLKKINTRVKSVMVLQEQELKVDIDRGYERINQIEFINPEQALNDIIYRLATPYVLFLHNTDYLSPTINDHSLQLPHKKTVLATCYHNRNIVTHRPLLVSAAFLKKVKLLSNHQIPFKEALFPAWLSKVEASHQQIKDGLVRQLRINSSSNNVEKEKFIQKYQLKKVRTEHPTISVLITNYNMGKYVETAIVSCLLQNEEFEQILIMDDGSTDNSYEQIQRFHDGKQVNVFHKQNAGKAKALNQLIPHVTSKFILELDADDWLDPDASTVIKERLSTLPDDVSVLYGNLRKWKQLTNDVLFKGVSKGVEINGISDLLSYRFPLGPRIYRTSILKRDGGFPVIEFEEGRMYEDVSMLHSLIRKTPFRYEDFTVYNVREHKESITKNNRSKWEDFLDVLKRN